MVVSHHITVMPKPIDARCTACGATFPREEATTETETELACPACGCSVVRGIPEQHTTLIRQENARCGTCGATFSRTEAVTETTFAPQRTLTRAGDSIVELAVVAGAVVRGDARGRSRSSESSVRTDRAYTPRGRGIGARS